MLLRSFNRQSVRVFSTTPCSLAGHSKWANIKHDKARNDAQKNKIANKFANAIAVAAKRKCLVDFVFGFSVYHQYVY